MCFKVVDRRGGASLVRVIIYCFILVWLCMWGVFRLNVGGFGVRRRCGFRCSMRLFGLRDTRSHSVS